MSLYIDMRKKETHVSNDTLTFDKIVEQFGEPVRLEIKDDWFNNNLDDEYEDEYDDEDYEEDYDEEDDDDNDDEDYDE